MSVPLFISYENFCDSLEVYVTFWFSFLYILQAKAQNLKGTEATCINLPTVNLSTAIKAASHTIQNRTYLSMRSAAQAVVA